MRRVELTAKSKNLKKIRKFGEYLFFFVFQRTIINNVFSSIEIRF